MRRSPSAISHRVAVPNRSAAVGESPGEDSPALHVELARQLNGLPRDLAVTLLAVGTCGLVIPGPIPPGLSFVLLGTIVLRPGLLMHGGGFLSRRFPRPFWVLIGFVRHFRTDLARRYPGAVPALPSHNAGAGSIAEELELR